MSKTILSAVTMALHNRMAKEDHRPFVLGICGAQGSGKSTLAEALAADLGGAGVPTAILSLDDIYKTKADRLTMAATVHPLFATRGVPGTHDIDLAHFVLDSLERAEAAPLPRFDKALDDRRPTSAWPLAPADTRVLILEGWCLGARPEPDSALLRPINWLEEQEDTAGVWRRYVNHALASDYQGLFGRIDLLVMLAAPGFDIVHRWRTQQEHALHQHGNGGMADGEIERFVRHYERLTRHILADMPHYADVTVALDEARAPREILIR
jgi:D-glycerate 3-kinase